MITIYTLADPRTNEIRYVGRAKNPGDRLRQHIFHAKTERTYKARWVRSLLEDNVKPIMEVIEVVDMSIAAKTEQYWIAQFRAWNFKLTNLSDGNDYAYITERKRTKEQSLSQSEKMKEFHKNESIEAKELRRKNLLKGLETQRELMSKGLLIKKPSKNIRVQKNSRAVVAINKETKVEQTYVTVSNAANSLNITASKIRDCLNKNNRRKSHKGFEFKYLLNY